MKIRHHLEDDMLCAYAAGDLSEAWSLLVATHLAFCPECRRKVGIYEEVGGALLDQVEPAEISTDSLSKVMARLDGQAAPVAAPVAARGRPVLPEPLRSYAGGDLSALKWRRLGNGPFHIPLAISGGTTTARLLKVPAGTAVPVHSHNGLELTMVLTGSFRDAAGHFGPGDVEIADQNVEHQPVADPGEDCVCLAVTDAPLRFKSLAARLVQPFLGI